MFTDEEIIIHTVCVYIHMHMNLLYLWKHISFAYVWSQSEKHIHI